MNSIRLLTHILLMLTLLLGGVQTNAYNLHLDKPTQHTADKKNNATTCNSSNSVAPSCSASTWSTQHYVASFSSYNEASLIKILSFTLLLIIGYLLISDCFKPPKRSPIV